MENQSSYTLPSGYHLKGERNEYTIDRMLGQGAFGITYLAHYRTTIQGAMGRGTGLIQVAVKEFFMKDMNTRNSTSGYLNETSQDSLINRYRRAFMREARNLAGLHHDNIVNVFEVIETNNTVYIVMEYMNGGSLDELIASKGHLSEYEAVEKMHKLCSAVAFMHDNRMLHLDIKPKNVMLDEDDNLYLIDFGLSKQYTVDGEPESSTTIGLGTPGYAPVEQAVHQDGDKRFRATLDVYALGATMYKMLTGKTPPNASEVSESVLDGDNLIPKRLKTAGVSDGLTQIVTKAMWPSSSKRYQTVKEFKGILKNMHPSDLKAEIEDEVTIIKPMSKKAESDRPRSEVDQHKAALIMDILGGLVRAQETTLLKREETIIKRTPPVTDDKKYSHDYVDLGLSVKWATCNVGANKPEAFGDYYAWGETSTKSRYAWENYRFRTSGDSYKNVKFNKYNTQSDRGSVDKRTTLELSDDVARQKWGGSWRMPTYDEFRELIDNCTWTWTTMNGVSGYKVTSKKSGYSSRSIFLPAAGYRYDTSLYYAGEYGIYWSSSLYTGSPYNARSLLFYSGGHGTGNSRRYFGQSVRPVCP